MARGLDCRLWALCVSLIAGFCIQADAQPASQAPVNLLAPAPREPIVPQSSLPDFLRGPVILPLEAGPIAQEAAAEPASPLTGTLEAPMVHSPTVKRTPPMQSGKPGEAVGP